MEASILNLLQWLYRYIEANFKYTFIKYIAMPGSVDIHVARNVEKCTFSKPSVVYAAK